MDAPQRSPQPGAGRWRQALVWALAAAVLGAVFAAWLQPDMAFALATRAWACF